MPCVCFLTFADKSSKTFILRIRSMSVPFVNNSKQSRYCVEANRALAFLAKYIMRSVGR